VGKVEPEKLQPLVERYLGSLPARAGGKGRGERWKDVGARPPRGVKRFEVKSGIEQKSTVALKFTGKARWSRPEQHLANSVGEAFALRLRDVLREDLGATYGVSVSGNVFRRPYEGNEAQIDFTCAPENVPKLLETVYREIRAVQKDGFSPAYVEKVKATQLRALEEALRTNDYWLDQLVEHYRYGTDPRFILEEKKLIEAMDAKSLQAAAQRYFDEKQQLVGVLEPATPAPSAAKAPAASR
jgi:zinc protease